MHGWPAETIPVLALIFTMAVIIVVSVAVWTVLAMRDRPIRVPQHAAPPTAKNSDPTPAWNRPAHKKPMVIVDEPLRIPPYMHTPAS